MSHSNSSFPQLSIVESKFNVAYVFCAATDRIYATVVRRRHHLVRRSDNGFDPEEYTEHPERYASTFSVKVRRFIALLSYSYCHC